MTQLMEEPCVITEFNMFQSKAVCRRKPPLYQREVVSRTIQKNESGILKCKSDNFKMAICVCQSSWKINHIEGVSPDGSVEVDNEQSCSLSNCPNKSCRLSAVCQLDIKPGEY